MSEEPREDEYAHLLSPVALAVSLTRGAAAPYLPSAHHRFLSDELVQLYRREPGYPRRLMVMQPPQTGKSTLTSHWYPCWNLALDPATKVMLCSYGLSLAAKFGRAARHTVQSHYPIIGASLLEDSKAAHRWGTSAGGGMECRGVGGGISGFGFDLGIIDDPVKDAMEAQSQVVRDNIWDWWEQAFLTRRGPDSIIVLVMTRWHEDDLAGRLLRTEPEAWRVVRLPAFAEEGDQLGRENGERLWPERYSQEHYEKIRDKSPRVFNALYQQRPTSPEGAGIHRDWWRFYTERPPIEEFSRVIQVWDPTFKEVDSSDFVAGGCLGLKGEDVYLLDAEHARMDTPNTIRSIRTMKQRWPQAKRVLIEETASGPAIMQLLKHDIPGILPVNTKNRSKEQRLHWAINSVAAYIEAGHVYLPRRTRLDEEPVNRPLPERLCEIADNLVKEGADFPYGEHDDLVDMLTHGVQHLLPASWSAERKAKKAAEDDSAKPVDLVKAHYERFWKQVKKRLDDGQRDQREAQKHGYGITWPGM